MLHLQDYIIHFQSADFLELKTQLEKFNYSKIFVLVDENTSRDCLPILKKALANWNLISIEIPAGEQHKNIQTCQKIWADLLENQADRKSVLLNLGGGVIGDMGGFCAATFKRGIDFIQIPTTLLAQVDASIGGKLGIDFGQVKNSIGLFQNPKAVYLCSDFFKTLPYRELRSGFAEIIKHALIADKNYWEELQHVDNLESINWQPIIERSLQIKKQIVEQDPFEKNIRKSLNFGHTIGHAIESLSWNTNQPLLHGEAVAWGMIAELELSCKRLGFPVEDFQKIKDYIHQFFPLYDLEQFDKEDILNLIKQDKKNEHDKIYFTLLKEIGVFEINVQM